MCRRESQDQKKTVSKRVGRRRRRRRRPCSCAARLQCSSSSAPSNRAFSAALETCPNNAPPHQAERWSLERGTDALDYEATLENVAVGVEETIGVFVFRRRQLHGWTVRLARLRGGHQRNPDWSARPTRAGRVLALDRVPPPECGGVLSGEREKE